jgi:VanZ family protein
MKIKTIIWVIWTFVLLAILLSPMRGSIFSPGGFRYWDKVVHFGLFAITGFMSIYGAAFFARFRYRLIFGLVIGLMLAVGTELGQALVPSRDTSLYDFLADLAGLCFGVLAYVILYRQEGIRSRLSL